MRLNMHALTKDVPTTGGTFETSSEAVPPNILIHRLPIKRKDTEPTEMFSEDDDINLDDPIPIEGDEQMIDSGMRPPMQFWEGVDGEGAVSDPSSSWAY